MHHVVSEASTMYKDWGGINKCKGWWDNTGGTVKQEQERCRKI